MEGSFGQAIFEKAYEEGYRHGVLEILVIRYRKNIGSKEDIISDALKYNVLGDFLEKLVQQGQIDILTDIYREKMIATEVLVEKSEARGVREDLIDRICKEETPEVAQKFFAEWDPDYSKLTFYEKEIIKEAKADKEYNTR